MNRNRRLRSDSTSFWLGWLLMLLGSAACHAAVDHTVSVPAPADQPLSEVDRKSVGCLGCHTETDRLSMHDNPAVKLGCTDCHGGDASQIPERKLPRMELEYKRLRDLAHVLPRYPEEW